MKPLLKVSHFLWPTGPVIAFYWRSSRQASATAISNRSTAGSATNASINIFWSLAHARVVIGDWKYQYNHHRPHSALAYQPPARYAANCAHR